MHFKRVIDVLFYKMIYFICAKQNSIIIYHSVNCENETHSIWIFDLNFGFDSLNDMGVKRFIGVQQSKKIKITRRTSTSIK